ncbi:MAG: hypothetical protein M0Z58_08405 [Nitrospiraceae bacterium]|nr:hypothetical protein [Nitrospiraceae bacterium]
MDIQSHELRQLALLTVSSHESRIHAVCRILDMVHDGLENLIRIRDEMNNDIKETLAATESLRRKDFNSIIREVFAGQDERERQIRILFKTYLEKQKEADGLVKRMFSERGPLMPGEFKRTILRIQLAHNEIEEEICKLLSDFQAEQTDTVKSIRSLFNKPGGRLPDFQEMLKGIEEKQKDGIRRAKKLIEKAGNERFGPDITLAKACS